jgi:hypothetical protein
LRPIKRTGSLALALPLLVCLSLPAVALEAGRDFTTYRPSTAATRIDAKDAPKVDGDLSDPVWQKAPVINEFYQLEPQEGRPASERTEVRVLYDADNIYFAFMNYDDEPNKILGRVKVRDGDIDNDDIVRIYLDPNMTRRNGYAFEVNPVGARREALLQNNIDYLNEWNTIWSAKTRILPNGWSVEVAIPFRSISYTRGKSDWGFDLFRLVRRKNERIRWSSINRAIPSVDISHSGTMTGVAGINEGLGLDVQAFALARYQRNWDLPLTGAKTGFSFRPSANAYYKITPALTGTLTYNTDFSDAPLDQRQVNISRFSIFYPERRDFFLQDASAFEFGGLVLRDDPNARPFISRRIGIVAGNPVNLIGGAKVSGTLGDMGIGALSVQTARSAFSRPQLLSTARFTMPVLEESKVGFLYTNGDPTGLSHNTVVGGDVQLQSSTLWSGNIIKLDAMFERSHDSAAGNDTAWGFEASLPDEPFNGFFRFKQVGNNFDPALGFVARPGIREYNFNAYWRWRPEDSFARFIDLGSWFDIYTGLDNALQSRLQGVWANVMTQEGDFFLLEDWIDFEDTGAFALPRGVPVPAGRYTFNTVHARIETAPARFISAYVDVQCCGFYDGRLLAVDTTLNLRPNETLLFSARHIIQQIHQSGGSVPINVDSVDMSVNFTPDMQLRGQIQYDNISNDLAYNFRYRWEFEPGAELLVVAGDDATFTGPYYKSHLSGLSVRVGKIFRV